MADAQDLGPSTGPSQDPNQGSGEALAQNKVPRRLPKKRTKTGCLTCRRRRIKCGEEKPICGNCVKSKRVCEGYAQRVVFKNPLGIPGIPPPSNHQDPHLQQHVRVPLYGEYASLPPQQAAAAAQHPMLAPRPLETASTDYHSQIPPEPIPASSISHLEEPLFQYPSNTQPSIKWRVPLDQQGQQPRPTISADSTNYNQYGYYNEQSGIKYEAAGSQMPPPITDWSTIANQPYNTQLYSHSTTEYRYPQPVERSGHNFAVSEQFTPSPNAQVIYVEDEADDYFDVESDEEMVDQKQTEGYNQLNLIMASAGQDGRLRSFTTHLNEPNILASYRPSLGSSPLNNPTTARIFAHFIHSTGPSLSIFERHPTDSSIMLSEPVSPAKQGLWSYTLPLMALEHPALLQAILAIGSLHIAYLQNIPTTVSLKHYHYALKRIGRAVSLPTRRKQIGTLAATELLAYYEVMSADHSKWNSHVAGAAHLIREIDFASLTRDLRAHRHKIRESRNQMGWDASSQQYYYMFSNETSEDDPFAEKEGSIDQELIGSLLGRKISYDKFGHVEGQNLPAPKKHFSRKDIENLRIQGDLYWWYTKQDMMHSLISGDKLFIPFYQQGRCPPRAGIGRLDAIYGTADHLWLLLSRVTDFGYRDRKRKIKAVRSAGTEWRPGPGVPQFMARFARGARPQGQGGPPNSQRPPSLGSQSSNPGSRAPTGSPSSTASRSSPPSEGPPMYGMVPPKGPTRVPTSFVEDRRGQEQTSEPSDCSVETSYDEAEREWEEILVAMDTFVQAISRDFQPLPPDVTVAIDSPFGSALQYRTLTIAVIWGFYYTGRILLHRLHPCMPPAMMVAAGVAGPTTAEYAQIIGRLMAGIYYPQRFNLEAGSLSPTLGSSLTEMTVPVFFGAVQYNDATQRAWTVSKLREISRLTGWKSSDAIAGGCEKAWVIAAKHGRGPPYERSFILNRDQAYGSPDVVERDLTQRATEYNDDRRFVTVQPPFRAHVAFGLLSLESDMQSLEL